MSEQTTYAMFHQQIPVNLQVTAEAASAFKLAAEKDKEKVKAKTTAD